MHSRLKELRKALGLTQKEFAESLDLFRTTISSYESGSKVPSDKTLRLITKTFNVNENWLIDNTGDMFNEDHASIELFNQVLELLDEDDVESLEFIKMYMKLNKSGRALIKELLTRFS
ncbi:MAG: helix-turn-helix domain-containing protein [Sarcina sp.]